VLRHYSTIREPGGVLHVVRKARRASRCRACAEIYGADTCQFVRAGLIGRKGVPEPWRPAQRDALEDVEKVLTDRGGVCVSCPGRCLSHQSQLMLYGCWFGFAAASRWASRGHPR
jgi:hypothetical protein